MNGVRKGVVSRNRRGASGRRSTFLCSRNSFKFHTTVAHGTYYTLQCEISEKGSTDARNAELFLRPDFNQISHVGSQRETAHHRLAANGYIKVTTYCLVLHYIRHDCSFTKLFQASVPIPLHDLFDCFGFSVRCCTIMANCHGRPP